MSTNSWWLVSRQAEARRWKDGSHFVVENANAEQSRCDRFVLELKTRNESLEKVQSLLELNHELNVSTRDTVQPKREQTPGSKVLGRREKYALRSDPMEGFYVRDNCEIPEGLKSW